MALTPEQLKEMMAGAGQKKKQMAEKSGQFERTVKIESGKSTYRILPSWRLKDGGTDPTFYHDFGMHFIKGTVANDKGSFLKAVHVCQENTFNRPCEICKLIHNGITNATNDETLKALEESKAGSSILVNAVRTDIAGQPTALLELRPSAFRQVLDLMETYGDVTDLQAGRDLIFSREGTGLNTKYTVIPAPNATELSAAFMDTLHDIDAYVAAQAAQDQQPALAATTAVAGALPAPAPAAVAPVAPAAVAPVAPAAVAPAAVAPVAPAVQPAAPVDDTVVATQTPVATQEDEPISEEDLEDILAQL